MGACQSQSQVQPQSKVAKKFKNTLEKDFLESIYPLPSDPVIKVKSRKPRKTALHRIEKVPFEAESADKGQVQAKQTAEWPNSAYGLLTINFKNKTTSGTGIMIGPNVVLTAGHNLYDLETKTYADLKSLKFMSGRGGLGSIGVKNYFVSPNYIKEQKEDYGILILSQSIGEVTGYFGLSCLEPQEIGTKKIVTGYPGDQVAYNLISPEHDQSGNLVWYQEEGHFYACGVHPNFLTRDMYQDIHKYLHQVNSKDNLSQFKEKTLELRERKMDLECLHILMKHNFEDLTILNLPWNNIGDEGAKILASIPSWPKLSQLNLGSNRLTLKGVEAVAQNTSWINLSHLNLSDSPLGKEGARILAQNSSWTNLSKLVLVSTGLGEEGPAELAKNTSWINLSHLNVSLSYIRSKGATGLAKNASWVNLSFLDLMSNQIGAEGAKGLAQNTSWINLAELYLSSNEIRNEGAKGLAQNTSWVNLSIVYLQYCWIGQEGARLLRENGIWDKTKYVGIDLRLPCKLFHLL